MICKWKLDVKQDGGRDNECSPWVTSVSMRVMERGNLASSSSSSTIKWGEIIDSRLNIISIPVQFITTFIFFIFQSLNLTIYLLREYNFSHILYSYHSCINSYWVLKIRNWRIYVFEFYLGIIPSILNFLFFWCTSPSSLLVITLYIQYKRCYWGIPFWLCPYIYWLLNFSYINTLE